MTAGSMRVPHEHQPGRSAARGAGHELHIPKPTSVLPRVVVGDDSRACISPIAGPSTHPLSLLGQKFLACSHELAGQAARDSAKTNPRPVGPFVSNDPPRLLRHANHDGEFDAARPKISAAKSGS